MSPVCRRRSVSGGVDNGKYVAIRVCQQGWREVRNAVSGLRELVMAR